MINYEENQKELQAINQLKIDKNYDKFINDVLLSNGERKDDWINDYIIYINEEELKYDIYELSDWQKDYEVLFINDMVIIITARLL